jgi:glycosyltransferase involved in cell wall biosynthesis
MISVIVPTRDSAAVLPVCLSALVPAAVSGLVREVILADGGSTDATLEIAADAGARVMPGAVATAVAEARSDWVLVLPPGCRLEAGWEAQAADHVDRRRGEAACFSLAVDAPGAGARLREGLARMGGHRPEHGLLVERARWAAPGPVRRLKARVFVP